MRNLSAWLTLSMLFVVACGGSPTSPTSPSTNTASTTTQPEPAAPTPPADPVPDPAPDAADGDLPAPAPAPAPAGPVALCDGDSPGIKVLQNLKHEARLLVQNDSTDCSMFGYVMYLLPPGARDTDPQIPRQTLVAFENAVVSRGSQRLFDLSRSLEALACGSWVQFDLYVNMDDPPDPPTTEGFRGNQIDLNRFGGAYYQKVCAETPPPPRAEPIPLTCELLNVSVQVLPFSTTGSPTITVPVVARWNVAGSAQFIIGGSTVTPAPYESGQAYQATFALTAVPRTETIQVRVTHPAGLVCSAGTQVTLPATVQPQVCPAVTPANMRQYVQDVSLVPTGARELAATFTVTSLLPAGCTIKLMHDAWLLESPSVFLPQRLINRATGEFGAGRHTLVLRVERQDCYWQNDLLLFDSPAMLITRMEESNYPFYAQRLLDARYDWHGCTAGG